MKFDMTMLLWLLFLLGQIFFVFIQSTYWVRDKKHPAQTHLDYLRMYWDILIARAVVGIIIFWFWIGYHDILRSIVQYFGYNVNLDIPRIPPVAFVLGVVMDIVVNFFAQKIKVVKIPEIPETEAEKVEEVQK